MAGAMLTYIGQAGMQVSALGSMQEEDDRFLMASRQSKEEGAQILCSEIGTEIEAVVRRMLIQAASSGEAKISGGPKSCCLETVACQGMIALDIWSPALLVQ